MAERQAAGNVNSILTVKTHDKLRTISQADFVAKAVDVLRDADRGHQTTVRSDDGGVCATIGLNGHRFFPDPDPDPLDDILRLALNSDKLEQK